MVKHKISQLMTHQGKRRRINNRVIDRGRSRDPVKRRSWALGGRRGNWLEKQSGSHSLDRAVLHQQGEEGSQEPQTSGLLLNPASQIQRWV